MISKLANDIKELLDSVRSGEASPNSRVLLEKTAEPATPATDEGESLRKLAGYVRETTVGPTYEDLNVLIRTLSEGR